MDLRDTPEQARYRANVRAELGERAHAAPAAHVREDISNEQAIEARRAWQRLLAEAGLVGVTWPQAYGGQGLGAMEQVIVNQELSAAGLPGLLDSIGVGMLGPTLIEHGSADQKERYLPPMLAAEEIWCQLFSEPGAGSDLAAVQCRAHRTDDGRWRLTGQKVWTSNAQFASLGLLLARSDPDLPKHQGLTMFIVPMDAEGVTVRPLRQITGVAEFNEVFLDDVALEAGSEVGPVNGGWQVALTTLMFERLSLSLDSEQLGFRPERFADALASDQLAAGDPEFRLRLGDVSTDLLAVRFGAFRQLTQLARGTAPGPEAALGKITSVRAAIEAGDLIVDALGPDALQDEQWADLVSFLPGMKSAGGTEEILRNVVGERVLGLAPAPRLDKDIPFRELSSRTGRTVG